MVPKYLYSLQTIAWLMTLKEFIILKVANRHKSCRNCIYLIKNKILLVRSRDWHLN